MIALAYIYMTGMLLFYLWEIAKIFYPPTHISLYNNDTIESDMVPDESEE